MLKLLKSLFAGSQPTRHHFAAPDPSFGYSELTRITTLLKQGDYDTVRDFYYAISPDKRSALIDGISLTEAHAKILGEWISKRSDCAVATVFNGAHWTYTAWVARTGKLGSEVTEKQAQTFFEHLEQAFVFLKASIEEGDQDAEPYARMLRVLMGLSEPLDTLYDYYNEMIRFAPDHLWGHMHMLTAASARWLGSDDQMFEFVNKTIASSKPGSLLHMLVPMAHTELWFDKAYENASVNHFLQNDVRRDIVAAYNNSVLSKDFQPSQLRPIVHNYFCFAFHYMGDARMARTERLSFGDYISLYPWAYEGIYAPKEVDDLLAKG
jgi:hypothetical protein